MCILFCIFLSFQIGIDDLWTRNDAPMAMIAFSYFKQFYVTLRFIFLDLSFFIVWITLRKNCPRWLYSDHIMKDSSFNNYTRIDSRYSVASQRLVHMFLINLFLFLYHPLAMYHSPCYFRSSFPYSKTRSPQPTQWMTYAMINQCITNYISMFKLKKKK